MLKTLQPVFFALLCLAFLSACKKDILNKTVSSGDTAKSDAVTDAAVNADYYPYRNGNIYSFIDSVEGSATVARSAIVILGDTSMGGISFSKTSAVGSSSNYYSSADGVTTLVSFNGEDKITTTLLKANEPVGSVWTDNFSNDAIPTTYEWKMVAKGITRIILGVTYKDVIQVHLNGTAEVPNKGKVVFADSDYFYAPNIGLVENINYNTITGKPALHRLLQTSSKS